VTAIDSTPLSQNFLSPLNYRFLLKRAPALNFYVQKINIPSVRTTPVGVQNRFAETFHHADEMEFDNLEVTFKVDEALENYMEVYNWMRGLAKPDNPMEYQRLNAGNRMEGLGLYSEIVVILLSSVKKPIYEFVFRNCMPIALSDMILDTTDDEVNYVTCTATFRYDLFDITRI